MVTKLLLGNAGALRQVLGLLFRNRDLVKELTKRDVVDRYAGQALGIFWTIAHPLFLMALYVFVFAVVFRTKISGVDMPQDYSTYILAGLIPWMAIQEAMIKTSMAITSNSSLVKQVVFPLEVLPAKSVLGSLFTQLVSTALLLVWMILRTGGLPATVLLLPVLLALQVLMMMGIGYFLSALGTYIRDAKDFVQLFGTAGMYIIPVVYLPGWVPKAFQPLIGINPFSYVVYCYQDALYFGRIQHPWAWLVFAVFSLAAFTFGFRFFRRLKSGFGSAL